MHRSGGFNRPKDARLPLDGNAGCSPGGTAATFCAVALKLWCCADEAVDGGAHPRTTGTAPTRARSHLSQGKLAQQMAAVLAHCGPEHAAPFVARAVNARPSHFLMLGGGRNARPHDYKRERADAERQATQNP